MDEYYSAMDRELAKTAQSREMKEIDRVADIGIDEWGTTTSPFEHQTQALKARIFHGASRVEFAFFGQGKGRKEASTPETFGKRERMDMRELAEFNKVETTTHATVGVQGLAGFNPQQGVFDDRQRKESIDEIKRAIHFAAEATTGGAVVFHTGEAFRSMLSEFKDDRGKPMFEFHPEEEKREQFYLADPFTKKIVAVKRNDKLPVPIIKKDENGNFLYLKDENGDYVKELTLAKYDKIHKGRIPIYDLEEDGSIKVELMDFNEWSQHRRHEYEVVGEKPPEKDIWLAKDFYQVQAINQVQYYMNFGRFHKGAYEKILEEREKLMKSLKFYKELKEKVPEEDWWKFKRENQRDHFIPPNVLDPVEYLEEQLSRMEKEIQRQTEYDIMGKRQSLETLEMVNRLKPATDFAVEETSKSMADIGIYAWQMTQKAHRDFKEGKANFDLKNDLYLAPENLFPETYGSHPDELERLVKEGRKSMAAELASKYGRSADEAKKISEKYIRATFDIGHINIWRKYFKGEQGESLEQRDKRFNGWLLGKTKDLINKGIIGHIHVSDNFGFHDEHLTAGDGNAPIKEFVKQAKAAGFGEFIVESGSFNPMTSLPDTWMHFDSPAYGLHVPGFTRSWWTDPSIGQTPHGWNNFYRSYFGRTEGPRYIVGDFAPSEDFKGAPFYTGIPLD